jgi:hypothetical protein
MQGEEKGGDPAFGAALGHGAELFLGGGEVFGAKLEQAVR